jgi:hypothetical protein
VHLGPRGAALPCCCGGRCRRRRTGGSRCARPAPRPARMRWHPAAAAVSAAAWRCSCTTRWWWWLQGHSLAHPQLHWHSAAAAAAAAAGGMCATAEAGPQVWQARAAGNVDLSDLRGVPVGSSSSSSSTPADACCGKLRQAAAQSAPSSSTASGQAAAWCAGHAARTSDLPMTTAARAAQGAWLLGLLEQVVVKMPAVWPACGVSAGRQACLLGPAGQRRRHATSPHTGVSRAAFT